MGLMKEFLIKEFGTLINASVAINVSYRTVQNWCDGNPAGILRYLPTITRLKCYDLTADQILEVVIAEVDAMDVGIDQ